MPVYLSREGWVAAIKVLSAWIHIRLQGIYIGFKGFNAFPGYLTDGLRVIVAELFDDLEIAGIF